YRSNLVFIFSGYTFVGPAGPVLAVLALSVIPASLSQIIGTSLSAIGYQKLELYLTALQVVALFASVVLFLPPIALGRFPGLVAVGVAILVSSFAALLLNSIFMFRLLAVRIPVLPIASIVGAGAVSFYAVSQLNRVLAVNRWYELSAAVALGFSVYFLAL